MENFSISTCACEYRAFYIVNITLICCLLNLISFVNCRPHNDQFHGGVHHHHHSHYYHKNGSTRFTFNDTNPRILNRRNDHSDRFSSDFVPERDHNAIVFQDSSDFVFPNSSEDESDSIIRPPKCRSDDTFCEEVDYYPTQQLTRILSRASVDKGFFGEDEAPPEIANRLGETEDMFFCTSLEKVISPKVAKNKNDKWRYIVNIDTDKYVQKIRVEVCSNPNGPCNLLSDPPSGYIVFCKQKFMFRRLLAVTDTGTPEPDTFQLPSACCCAYKRDPDFLVSFGRSSRRT
ncbi:protein spaetzle-like isoform X2 [Agrilus planipennis]|uniref:Protein spaetzle-like isoform X2 n=1 Tax=Agrilus planipennis TaxID=224129 RepID=A0A1W4WN18_AGRPL|nr:protein spaetzle-like isoform X2 [Agrilus planipennis]